MTFTFILMLLKSNEVWVGFFLPMIKLSYLLFDTRFDIKFYNNLSYKLKKNKCL